MSDYPLLPSDKYLARLLGITDKEYALFKAEARKRYREAPSPLVVNEVGVIALVLTVIGIGFQIAASFFKPRLGKPGRPAQLKAETDRQEPINSVERYAPRVGFDAAQEIARIGQSIPLVYAKREQNAEGKLIGGIRVTCPLIWSQIKSYGGNQLLRAIFLLGEGTITSIDPNNFAIGSNTIGSYQLSEAGDDARMTIYLKKGGGQSRLNDTHYLIGRPASTDPGRDPSGDVFAIDGESDFSAASKPTTQTVFGLYAPIGNNLGFRVNPVFRPGTQANLVPKGDDGDAKVKCDRDVIALSQRKKYVAYFSTRSGLISGSVGTKNAECTYKLFKSSDRNTDFSVASAASSWGVSVEVIVSDLFAMGLDGSVSLNQVKNLVSVTSPTVDVENTSLTSTLTFNTDSATTLFNNSKPGNYRFEYRVIYTNSEGLPTEDDDDVEVTKKWAVDVKVEQGDDSYEWQDNSSFLDGIWTYDPNTETVNQSTSSSITVDGEIIVTKGDTTITYDGQGITSTTNNTLSRSFSVTYNEADFHEELAGDVAATVSAKQRGWDDSLIVSELYKVGSAICVCTSRNPADDVFQSEADFDGENPPDAKDLEVKFKTLRPGETQIYDAALLERDGNVSTAMSDRATGTNGPHIHRIALGEVSTSRECKKVEIGLKSVVGHRISGICNFKDTLSFSEVDQKACKSKQGKVVSKGETLKVSVYQSGVISCSVERISFFRISYRESGTTGNFTDIDACFGIRGITQQNQFNSLLFTMPDKKRWTFRFEPLSGWEVRNNKAPATGPLYIVDSKLDSTQQVGIAKFNGTLITRESGSFWINVGKRGDLGLGHPDGGNYIDDWGKLAEQFIYEEVSSSTQGPEHEIVYINEIVENNTEPLYDYMAIVGLNIRSSTEWQQFSQFSCYVTGGVNNTHLFPEILQDILTNDRYGLGHAITAQQIDTASFAAATTWCSERGYYFDGVISERQNIRQWAADVAATMLLIFGEVNGKFFLRPAIPFDGAEIKGMFTADNVVENTYQMEYFDSEDRLPIQVSIKYREERDSDSLTNPGLFPTEREILIRETNYSSETDKIEPIDVSDYVTSRAHALDIAKFIIRMRRVPTHSIRFQTTFDGVTATLAPGDYIRCAIDSTYYDDFNNGVVDASGALTSTQSITDGEYQVFAWDGSGSTAPSERTLTVSGGGTTASPTGVIFSVQNVTTSIRTYQIESLGIEESGAITIEAVHMPTDEMTADWDGGWTIQE